MTPAELPSPGLSQRSRMSTIKSDASQYDSDLSTTGDDRRSCAAPPKSTQGDREEKRRWLNQVKRWLWVTEPSAQAMKQQKRSIYQRLKVDHSDPREAAKMRVPTGRVPEGATTSTTGPVPEKALLEKARERRKRMEFMGHDHGSHSISSELSFNPSMKDNNSITPWENT